MKQTISTTWQSDEQTIRRLCDRVRQAAFALHCYLGHGHLEKIYQRGLGHRLELQGLVVESQVPLQVRDEDGTILGDFIADFVVEGGLLIELKACRAITNEHVSQVLGYLRAAGLRHALLINFGAARFEIRKFIW